MEELLNLNASSASNEKVKKFENLDHGTYLVKSFKLKDTPYGLRLFVQIDDFYLILPPRYTDKINSDEQLKELNDGKFKMIYRGKNKDEFNKLMIDFKPLMEDESAAADSTSEEEEIALKKKKITSSSKKPLKRARQ